VAFIDEHRDRFGVEPICRVLSEHGCKIAPNTYWVARKRPSSARAVRDEYLRSEIARVHAENLSVYGADKVWAQLNREGIRVARCTVERLMREMGLTGARRGRAFKVTTRSDQRQRRPDDLVDRQFKAPAPNRLWVADLTYVRTSKVGSTPRSSSTSFPASSSAGRRRGRCVLTSPSTPWRWPSGTAPEPARSSMGSSTTATGASSPVPVDPLQRASRRQRHRGLGRLSRRLV
jgi:HTH-like domain